MQAISPRNGLATVLALILSLAWTGTESATGAAYYQNYTAPGNHPRTATRSKRALLMGRYRATLFQKLLAHQRALRHHNRLIAAKKKPRTRYVAVRTLDPTREQLAEISRKAGVQVTAKDHWHCVMIWDTYAKTVVGNDCYAMPELPAQGSIT